MGADPALGQQLTALGWKPLEHVLGEVVHEMDVLRARHPAQLRHLRLVGDAPRHDFSGEDDRLAVGRLGVVLGQGGPGVAGQVVALRLVETQDLVHLGIPQVESAQILPARCALQVACAAFVSLVLHVRPDRGEELTAEYFVRRQIRVRDTEGPEGRLHALARRRDIEPLGVVDDVLLVGLPCLGSGLDDLEGDAFALSLGERGACLHLAGKGSLDGSLDDGGLTHSISCG